MCGVFMFYEVSIATFLKHIDRYSYIVKRLKPRTINLSLPLVVTSMPRWCRLLLLLLLYHYQRCVHLYMLNKCLESCQTELSISSTMTYLYDIHY